MYVCVTSPLLENSWKKKRKGLRIVAANTNCATGSACGRHSGALERGVVAAAYWEEPLGGGKYEKARGENAAALLEGRLKRGIT